jgi:hypothetical protein
MKYIRTKDGIFEVVKEDGNWLEIISNFERKMQCHCVIKKHAVIKQSDTIEELCDECISVLEDGNGSHIWHESEFEENTPYLFHKARMFKEDDEIFYGAIWTDKGLIYVAKMNDKGELELL